MIIIAILLILVRLPLCMPFIRKELISLILSLNIRLFGILKLLAYLIQRVRSYTSKYTPSSIKELWYILDTILFLELYTGYISLVLFMHNLKIKLSEFKPLIKYTFFISIALIVRKFYFLQYICLKFKYSNFSTLFYDSEGSRSNNFYLDISFFILFLLLTAFLLKASIMLNYSFELIHNLSTNTCFFVYITGHQWYWSYTLNYLVL